MNFTPKHDNYALNNHHHHHHKNKNSKNKSSFLHNLKSAARKITIVFTAFGSNHSAAAAADDVSDVVAGQTSFHVDHNSSSGFSSGSKHRGVSPSRTPLRSFASPKRKVGQVYGSLSFTLEDIRKATKNFSQDNVIGEGGFGTVYKGQLRDGPRVAVKRAKKDLFSNRAIDEFRNEILAFSKIEHLNLVKFYGYLEHPDEKIIVVEYVDNGTLFDHLHGNQGFGLQLGERLDIAIDVAHAITCLHTYNDPPIIHRDIKASNVLITAKLRAKVADFGLARLVPDGQDVTHISTQIKGTIGYLDPEYMKTYQLTEKSDVYSFGVLLVELVTGRHPVELQKPTKEKMTTGWALSKLRAGMPVLAMDPKLQRNPPSIKAVERILELARECTGPVRQSRPSMKKCVEALWAVRKDFKAGDHLGSFTSHRSVDLLASEARKNRQHSLGIDGESYSFKSA